jgi:hypothetical protein
MNMGCASAKETTEEKVTARRAGSGKDGTLDATAAVTGRTDATAAGIARKNVKAAVTGRMVRNLASGSAASRVRDTSAAHAQPASVAAAATAR